MEERIICDTLKENPHGGLYCTETWEVCTGKLQRRYTLYHHKQVVRSTFAAIYYSFVGILGETIESSIKNAKKYEVDLLPSDFEEVNLRESDEKRFIDAFDMHLTECKPGMFYCNLVSSFWDLWKKDKENIKAQGFWVSKKDDKWFLFCKPTVQF